MDKGKFKKYIVDENTPIIDVLKTIDMGAKGCVFVCKDGVLLASVSDGDVRRYIINNGELMQPISKIANYNPCFAYVDDDTDCYELMKKKAITALPIVDSQKRVVNIIFASNFSKMNYDEINIPVVVMAGGKGTRLYPYTKILPKPLIPIGELPIAQIILEEFYKYKCTDFHMIVNYKKNMIRAYFGEIEKGYNLNFIDEDIPLGTGGGLGLLKGQISGTFFLTNCDVLITADLSKVVELHRERNNAITMVCCNKKINIPYGVIEKDEEDRIISMNEKPDVSVLTNTGMYVVEAEVIDEIHDKENVGFPDIIDRCIKRGMRVGVYVVEDYEWLDMGVPEELERMKKRLLL